ncbi:hypothetical protein OQA88_5876 [Cercophora sp. LCS_1]
MANSVPCSLVDSASSLQGLLESLEALPPSVPCLYVDLEGVNLCRHGTVSILTIFVEPQNKAYLVDIHTMQSAAFVTSSSTGTTLKSVLESPSIVKVFFDVRNDSDALFTHYGIRLQGIEDVQLMENAGRQFGNRDFIFGLDRCITRDLPITPAERAEWKEIKDRGKALFAPEIGGSYAVFNQRPMAKDIERYCVNDVVLLPKLRNLYWQKLDVGWRWMVTVATAERVQESQSPSYQPQGESKRLSPWGRGQSVAPNLPGGARRS